MPLDRLLQDFAHRRWETNPFDRLMAVADQEPSQLEKFVSTALSSTPRGGTFVDTALSYVSEQAFERLANAAVEAFAASRENEAAQSVIAYASLQFPALLHPRLEEVFHLRPNADRHYENWPWRESGDVALPDLARLTADSFRPESIRSKAWLCLLETRSPETLRFAANPELEVPLPHPTGVYLREVGFASPTTALYDPRSSHLAFPEDHFSRKRPSWMSRTSHPTWRLPRSGPAYPFGGYAEGTCGLCRGALHHLLSMPLPDAPSVTLATCLSCLGWERQVLSYRHSTEGLPDPVDHGDVTPEFPAEALRETSVTLSPTPARWRWQDWALSNSRENLFRVGGYPSWIHSAEYPDCVSCKTPMRFVLQLDSDLPTVNGMEWSWGRGGICYGFWCATCHVSSFLWQCT